jgi:hypothetical protein
MLEELLPAEELRIGFSTQGMQSSSSERSHGPAAVSDSNSTASEIFRDD